MELYQKLEPNIEQQVACIVSCIVDGSDSDVSGEPLGSIAKFASHAQNKVSSPRDEATIKRFKLQSIARRLLPHKRVSNCLRQLVPGADCIELYHVPDRDSAHYHNLRTCDSVWDCAICAAKITERRRVDLMLGVMRAVEMGYVPVMVTSTLSHHKGDKLADLLQALLGAYRSFKSGRAFQAIKSDYGYVGSVRSLEVTWGLLRQDDNGAHPHCHDLWFLEPIAAAKLDKLENELKTLWSRVLKRKGYDASWRHGLTLRTGDDAAYEYIAKYGHEPAGSRWTVEWELTKAHTKKASEKGVTAFQLLELYEAGNQEAGRLFQEYSAVFHGRAQLVWSRGLRGLLGMDEEKSDSELAAEEDSAGSLLTVLSRITWYKLLRLPRDVRGELLCIARAGDVSRIEVFLSEALGENVALRNCVAEPEGYLQSGGADESTGGQPGPDNTGEAHTLASSAGCGWAGDVGSPAGGLGEGSDLYSPGDVDNGRTSKPAASAGRTNVVYTADDRRVSRFERRLLDEGWTRVT